MKRITLPKIRRALETMTHEVTVDPEIAERARRAVERMLRGSAERSWALVMSRRKRACQGRLALETSGCPGDLRHSPE